MRHLPEKIEIWLLQQNSYRKNFFHKLTLLREFDSLAGALDYARDSAQRHSAPVGLFLGGMFVAACQPDGTLLA